LNEIILLAQQKQPDDFASNFKPRKDRTVEAMSPRRQSHSFGRYYLSDQLGCVFQGLCSGALAGCSV